MKQAIIAMVCIILIVSTPISASANELFNPDDDPRNLGEALIINVEHVEPTIIRTDYFQNNDFEAYVFLKGSTLGTFLFGTDAPDSAPFYGDMKIKNIVLRPDAESSRYISGLSQIKRQIGDELIVDSAGNIDLGYTKVRFRKNPIEEDVPDKIDIDVTAQVYFDVTTGFGNLGAHTLNLAASPDKDSWHDSGYKSGEIWGGRAYLRLVSIDGSFGNFELYDTQKRKIQSFRLAAGSGAEQFTLPGGLRAIENLVSIKLDQINRDPSKANVVITNNGQVEFDKTLVKGMRVAPGSKWKVNEIYTDNVEFIDDEGNKKSFPVEKPHQYNPDEWEIILELDLADPDWKEKFTQYWRGANQGDSSFPQFSVPQVNIQFSESSQDQILKPTGGWYAIVDSGSIFKKSKLRLTFNEKWHYQLRSLGNWGNTKYEISKEECEFFKQKDLFGYVYDQALYDLCISLANLQEDPLSFQKGVYTLREFVRSYKIGENMDNKLEINGESFDAKSYDEAIIVASDLRTEGVDTYKPGQTQTTTSDQEVQQTKESINYYELAIDEYQNALASGPSDLQIIYDSYLGIASSYELMDRPLEALRYYMEAEEYSQYNQGNAFDFESKYKGLIERLTKGKPSVNLGDGVSVTLLSTETQREAQDSFIYTVDGIEKQPGKVNQDIDLGANVIDGDGNQYTWRVQGINTNSIIVIQQFKDPKVASRLTERTLTLQYGQNNLVPYDGQNTKSVYIKKIDLTRSAIVSITPGIRDNYGTSQFTIHLPIEKRTIQLTPEQIDKQIAATDKALGKLDGIINKLGNIVKTWKVLCFSVFAFLTIKNTFFTNPVGRKLAVERMQTDCQQGIGSGNYDYSSIDDCMKARSDELNQWVEASKTAVDETEELFEDFSWDDPASVQGVSSELGISSEELKLMREYGYVDATELRDIVHAKKSGWEEADAQISGLQSRNEHARVVTQSLSTQQFETPREREIAIREIRSSLDDAQISTEDVSTHLADANERVRGHLSTHYQGKTITSNLPIYEGPDGNFYTWRNGERLTLDPIIPPDSTTILRSTRGDYYRDEFNNVYLSSRGADEYSRAYSGYSGGNPEVYYDKDNKNRPAYIPLKYSSASSEIPKLDYANYVEVYVDNQGKYHYTILNVGENGRLDIGADGYVLPNGDDRIVVHSSLLDPENPTSRTQQYSTLLNRIKAAYRDANVGVSDGDIVRIQGKNYPVQIMQAKAKSSMTQCTYLMPETDCKILFGVCDPVMCPVSRFDLGGTWKLGSSVVESGIIGSIILGLPNFNIPYEPVPICLTGIHAGLENIYSMLGSYRDCLEVAKVKGESVGICNEIRSLYICDILWHEALALVDVFGSLKNIIAANIFGTGGKGEVDLKWQSNWDQMTDSFNFFTKEYAQTAFAAFQSRSTQEIGTEICKAAIFGQYPGGGDLLAQLTEPESPPQFTGWFEEDLYTSVDQQSIIDIGNPTYGTGQSAYRIYYHIYAGRNTDVRYQVYLRDSVGNKIPVTDERGVAIGGTRYLKKGETVDKSFTITGMPPGFNEMCIEINGGLTCGFGSVSSAFSMNYLKDQLIKDQIGKNINSSKDCLPDEPHYIPGFVQSGVKRVCSVYDPDGVGESWIQVGTCGYDDRDRFLGDCYLYKQGVNLYDLNYSITENIPKKITEEYEDFSVEDIELAKQDIAKLMEQEESARTKEERERIISEYRILIRSQIDPDITGRSHHRIGEVYKEMGDSAAALEIPQFIAIYQEPEITLTPEEIQSLAQLMRVLNDHQIKIGTVGLPRTCNCGKYCEDYAGYILESSQLYGISPLLVLALMMQESSCQYNLESNAGAYGLMQLMESTADEVCGLPFSYLKGEKNTKNNIMCGSNILHRKYQTYKNGLSQETISKYCSNKQIKAKYASYKGWHAALRGYNGWGCGKNAEVDFVEQIMSRYEHLKSLIEGGNINATIPGLPQDVADIFNLPPVETCEEHSKEECDLYPDCYLHIRKDGLFGADWLAEDTCEQCNSLQNCPDIKNEEKCNKESCASKVGLVCKWDSDKEICATEGTTTPQVESNVIVQLAQREYGKWGETSKEECDSEMQDELNDYFTAAGYTPDQWTCSQTAWSAAFISYIMQEAGVNFPSSTMHSNYFTRIRDNPGSYGCTAHPMTESSSIKPGDIICRNRQGNSYNYNTLEPSTHGHCDIVVSLSDSGSLEYIGGNLGKAGHSTVKKVPTTINEIITITEDSYYGFLSCST